jgi:hypothetical protein
MHMSHHGVVALQLAMREKKIKAKLHGIEHAYQALLALGFKVQVQQFEPWLVYHARFDAGSAAETQCASSAVCGAVPCR